jgi:hypothetical protein
LTEGQTIGVGTVGIDAKTKPKDKVCWASGTNSILSGSTSSALNAGRSTQSVSIDTSQAGSIIDIESCAKRITKDTDSAKEVVSAEAVVAANASERGTVGVLKLDAPADVSEENVSDGASLTSSSVHTVGQTV